MTTSSTPTGIFSIEKATPHSIRCIYTERDIKGEFRQNYLPGDLFRLCSGGVLENSTILAGRGGGCSSLELSVAEGFGGKGYKKNYALAVTIIELSPLGYLHTTTM